jgi:aflatoxin B1 aldehyde reductase
MPKAPITNIIFGTMTLGYRGYGARVHDAATADAMLGTVLGVWPRPARHML